ncbi:DUF4123 domain-containing protein [Burkholderia ubonensis]|uniref:DUF4123 domain-containing protein n=1 Tax=Burkholderia ubonensis TaxID=101571 RepID=UPI000AAF21CE|nr:DUF4123 domain-containing protein [Burkholderia ubonensis]
MLEADRVMSAGDTEAAWEQWRKRLLSQFEAFDASDASGYLYILADARANPDLGKLLARVPKLEWASLWQGTVVESYADIAPYLIAIDRFAFDDSRDLQSRLVRRLWKESSGLHMLTWIWSPFPTRILTEHFQSFCRYSTPDKRAFFLHFYDNRILARLRAVWSAEQAQAFLSPCAEIWYRDRELNEIVWRNDADAADGVVDGEQVLTVEQHMALLRLGRADKLAMQLRTMYGAMLDYTRSSLIRSSMSIRPFSGSCRRRRANLVRSVLRCRACRTPLSGKSRAIALIACRMRDSMVDLDRPDTDDQACTARETEPGYRIVFRNLEYFTNA